MITLAIASLNPVKVQAAHDAFLQVFYPEVKEPFYKKLLNVILEVVNPEELKTIPVDVFSEVSPQPKGERETLKGALNRLTTLKQVCREADYFVAIESGIVDECMIMEEIGYALVASRHSDRIYRGQMPRFEIPFKHAQLVREGMELGSANDIVTGSKNSKQKGGVVAEVTSQLVTRQDMCYQATILAFSSLRNAHLYTH